MAQQNPLFHPPFYLIDNISPHAPISTQVQQIDQLNTLLLQEIDANFAKFHQIITTKILPELKRFAIGAEPVRETSHFWKSFFEHAYGIRSTDDDSTHMTSDSRQHGDSILSTPDARGEFMIPPAGDDGPVSSTPVPNRTHWSDEDSMASPFDRMDQDWKRMQLEEGYAESSSAPTPSLPSGYSNFNAADASYDVSTGTSDPPDLLPPRREPPAEDGTPKAKPKWTGLTDLRNTPLNAKFPRPKPNGKQPAHARGADDAFDSDDDMRMSPPVTMKFTLPPRVHAVYSAGRTPVKLTAASGSKGGEAKMILDDLMEEMGSMDSPAMPTPEAFGRYSVIPSDLGTGTRLFASQVDADPRQSRKSVANTSFGSDILDQPNPPAPVIYDDDDSFDDDSFDSDEISEQQPGSRHALVDDGDISDMDTAVFGGRPQDQPGATRFELMRQDEMETWNGGRLEDAEPDLAASPLYAQRTRK